MALISISLILPCNICATSLQPQSQSSTILHLPHASGLSKKALSFAIRNMSVLKRNTKLKERLNPSSEHQEHKIYSISKESEYMIAAEPTVEYNKK